ncbi:MAG: LysM peptidoglycan-binding domain-containing protein, partial [Bacteroidia bacterium]
MKFNLIITVISLSFLFLNINIGQAAPPDSTGLRTENGRNFIIHKVEPKEGWMSIARRYNVSMEQVKLANPGIQDLKIGQLVNVPVTSIIKINDPVETKIHKPEEKAIEAEVIAEAPPVKEKYRTAVVHKVATGETLYSICKKYNARTEEIREWNDIEDNNLQVGQELTVGYVFQYNNGKNLPPVTAVSKVNDDELYASAGEVKKTRKELRKEKRESKNNASEEIVTENSDLANT